MKLKAIHIIAIVLIGLFLTRIVQPITDAELVGGATPPTLGGKWYQTGNPITIKAKGFFFHIIPTFNDEEYLDIYKEENNSWILVYATPRKLCFTPHFYINSDDRIVWNQIANYGKYNGRPVPQGKYKAVVEVAGEKHTLYFHITDVIPP